MNSKWIRVGALLMAGVWLSCGKASTPAPSQPQGANIVGLVFDVGGRGDKSFNDASYKGLEDAKSRLGVDYQYIEPSGGSDRESALRQLASTPNVGLLFGIGFIFTDDITTVARAFPDKKFACVDYSYDPSKPLPPNLAAIEFREEEGSFLVGAVAGLVTKTNKVGFVGGMESPLIRKFEKGYAAGVKYVNPKAEVLVGYAGVTGEAFRNPAKGKELALSQYSQNADIIYHASGVTGLGVFEAARQMKKLAIGVDMDQWKEAPGFILTSMIKKVDVSVFSMIKDWKEEKFKGGAPAVFGLQNGGVDFVYDDNNRSLIPADAYAKVQDIKKKIISGEIKVPTA